MRLSDGSLILQDEQKQYKMFVQKASNTFDLLVIDKPKIPKEKLADYVLADPLAVWPDDTVIYYTNRRTIADGFSGMSINALSSKTGVDIPIIPAEEWGEGVQFIGASDEKVVGYLSRAEVLLIYGRQTGKTDVLPFHGYPDSLSPDGKTLLYRLSVDHIVQPEFYAFDLLTKQSRLLGMPEGYFYNGIGAWSENGKMFAFYLNGKDGNDPEKPYRTNVKIGVLDATAGVIHVYEKPESSSSLYTLGSISWIGNQFVVAVTDRFESWVLDIKGKEG